MSNANFLPSVTVIILHYNELDLTRECIRSVLLSKYPNFDILIVDNGSTNGSYNNLVNEFGMMQKITLVRSVDNLLFAGGFDFGARHAVGEFIILLSNDTIVDPSWIEHMISCIKGRNTVFIQPQILSYQDKNTIDNIGGRYSWWGMGYGIGHGENKRDPNPCCDSLDYTSATTCMINRSFYFEVGGYDPWYRSHYEDVDLSLRVKKKGGSCAVCYPSIIYHKGSVTYRKHALSVETLLDIRKNRVRTILKNFHGLELLGRLILCLGSFIPLLIVDILARNNMATISLKATYHAFVPTSFSKHLKT